MTTIPSWINPQTYLPKIQNAVSNAVAPFTAPKPTSSVIQQGSAGSYGTSVPAPVYAPKLDIAALNAKARASAEGAVNPYYTKVLNEFLAQQAVQRQQRQTQYQTDVTNIQDTLKNTQEANKLAGERTTEDVANNRADINLNADQFQQDSGQQFDAARTQQAGDVAQAGLTGSGLGNKAQAATQTNRNQTENRQAQKFQEQHNQQEMFKGRTFADLIKSSADAAVSAEKGKTAVKFDLDNYLQNAQYQEQQQRNSLEQDRLAKIADEQRNQARLGFNQYLAGITDPAKLVAATQTYGGQF